MSGPNSVISTFGLRELAPEDSAFVRLWRGFMTARAMIALVLLILLGGMHWLASPPLDGWLVALCGTYLLAGLAVRAFGGPRDPGRTFDAQWVSTIGVDLIAFSVLQFTQAGGINYVPLFALPLLLASVLGSLLLALGTAAAIALLLLADAWHSSFAFDMAPRFLQAALTGTGFFIVALLANQLATRLVREEQRARASQHMARVQIEVNELVIETLASGVLVVDGDGIVRVANPAAHRLLGIPEDVHGGTFPLPAQPEWEPLAGLARQTFSTRAPQMAEVNIAAAAEGPRRMHVRTRLTATHDSDAESLCVMFMEDLREMEARLRTEKLAAMGRMSAAVAHEIRNPLAAIVQANALLDEDLSEPAHKRLSLMVSQNAQRLARIVEEILDISRAQQAGATQVAPALALDDMVRAVCADWALQAGCADQLETRLRAPSRQVVFEGDHLRRVLVNLLDNALRYASRQPGAILVATEAPASGPPVLRVWSDGAPIEQSVQRHLFEPFFSSESRSSGLGLYICRELCERHGATIGHQRARAGAPGIAGNEGREDREGNEFFVNFRPPAAGVLMARGFDTMQA